MNRPTPGMVASYIVEAYGDTSNFWHDGISVSQLPRQSSANRRDAERSGGCFSTWQQAGSLRQLPERRPERLALRSVDLRIHRAWNEFRLLRCGFGRAPVSGQGHVDGGVDPQPHWTRRHLVPDSVWPVRLTDELNDLRGLRHIPPRAD